jgi:dUTPase
MSDLTYRLELLPTEAGAHYYKPVFERSNENAGFDVFLAEDCQTQFGTVSLTNLGCRARMVRCYADEMEEDVHYWLSPRSSIWKAGVTQANSLGIMDKSYRGILMGAVLPIYKPSGYWDALHEPKTGSAVWVNAASEQKHAPLLEKGTRLFQILAPDMGWIKEVRIVSELPETQRGDGGFGSTGK